MFNSDILDLAISICFIYFLLSLLSTTINEIINSIFKIRSKCLEKALKDLFFDEQWDKVYAQLIKSPYIQTLKETEDSFPSYIPSKNFALAIVDLLHSDKTQLLNTSNLVNLVNQSTVVDGDARTALVGLLNQSGNDYDKFISGLEKMYNDAMDRVNGWFKKNNRKILIVICFIITISLNVDTIQITNVLWKDKNTLKHASEISVDYIKGVDSINTKISVQGKEGDSLIGKIYSGYNNAKNIDIKIKEIPIPIGWSNVNMPSDTKNLVWEIMTKILGWTLTAFALFLGAPFWFDTLNKMVNLRNTGNKPEKPKDDQK